MTLDQAVGWVAVLLAAAMTVAQARRLRTSVAGVSTTTWALLLFFNGWITIYGFILGSWPLVSTGVSSALLQLWVLWRCPPERRVRRVLVSAVVTVAAIAVPAALFGLSGAVFGAMSVALVLRAPQIRNLARTRDASGVSASTWVLATVNNLKGGIRLDAVDPARTLATTGLWG